MVFFACLIAASAFLYLAPRIVPAAAIRPGAVAFAAGMLILVAGLVLRGWSFKAMGEYFTFTVMVSSDQPVVTAGPAAGHPLAHPRRGERAADHARRPVPRLRRAAQAPRPLIW